MLGKAKESKEYCEFLSHYYDGHPHDDGWEKRKIFQCIGLSLYIVYVSARYQFIYFLKSNSLRSLYIVF